MKASINRKQGEDALKLLKFAEKSAAADVHPILSHARATFADGQMQLVATNLRRRMEDSGNG